MRLEIAGLGALARRLEALRLEETMAGVVAAEAAGLAEAVREGLGERPGSGAHERPWERSGSLRASIGVQAQGLAAVVGSSDAAAAPQEMGTVRLQPRPFLAPVAAVRGEMAAGQAGLAVEAAIKGAVAG